MSGAIYRRATKKHAVRVEHTDGSATVGFLPIPLGMDFIGVMMQAQSFIDFEMEEGERTLMNVASIKRITSTQPEESEENNQSAADKAKAKREAENAEKRAAEEKSAEETDGADTKKSNTINRTADEYDALELLGLRTSATRDDIQTAYRKLVKLYHPDRLRGLGVSPKKIEFAAERLSEINNAYRTLMAAAKAA